MSDRAASRFGDRHFGALPDITPLPQPIIPVYNQPNTVQNGVPMAIPASTSFAPSAIIDGTTVTFHSPREKFEALTEAWDEQHGGSSVVSLNHLIYHQIIGMVRRLSHSC